MLQSSEIFCWDVESTAQPGAELQALGFHLLNWVLGNTSCPDTPCVTYQSTILIRGEQKYWISKSCEIEIKNGLYNIHFILSSEVIFLLWASSTIEPPKIQSSSTQNYYKDYITRNYFHWSQKIWKQKLLTHILQLTL